MRYLLIFAFSFIFFTCTQVPISGRQQLSLIPNSTMLNTSFSQYDQFISENKLSTNQHQLQLVKNVGLKIQKAVEEYFISQGQNNLLDGYAWEFNLVESEELNAWCMPGGKVVIYTGILPVTQTDQGLAVVMGHEIAHAVANHGSERMSQGLLAELGGMALNKAIQEKPEQTRQLWMSVYGMGAQFGYMLPYSRLHESEADYLGLIFLTMAGYNPDEAITFWERMASMKQGQAPPEFLSTHPSDETRIKKIKKALPEIKTKYGQVK